MSRPSSPTQIFPRAALLPLLLAGWGCGGEDGAGKPKDTSSYEATIRWTSHGIPHVVGSSLANAGFGAAYAEARFNVCILADQIVRVRSERSKTFGPGDDDANLASDFGILALDVYEKAVGGLDTVSQDMRSAVEGYVAGYNAYLQDTPSADLPAQCAGADWVKPITAHDLFAYYYLVALQASGGRFLQPIADAAPPGAARYVRPTRSALLDFRTLDLGSNGWAIGKDLSESGNAMVLSNPHFPWEGNLRFWEKHVTVPGELDVYGTALVGVGLINIGFNRNVAWTHTVTTARHFTLYRLDLVAGKPTTYLYDGQERDMSSREITIQVAQPDGSLAPRSRTVWRSHYGPMVSIEQLGGWSDTVAFTLRDANEDNFAIGDQWLAINRAKSVQDIVDANERVHGIPWVNTMAADDQGNVLYIDASRTPNLSAAALAAYEDALKTDLITAGVNSSGGTLLDGGDSLFEWVDDAAAAPGLVAVARSPQLLRTDYVANANDSHWLSNASAPLEGFSRMFGAERAPQSPRTRMNLMMLTERTPDGATGADGRFSFAELEAVQFVNRASVAELVREAVVARCAGVSSHVFEGESFDLTEACAVLAAWDGRLDLESVGATLWREWVFALPAAAVSDAGPLFAVAFDPDDPVATPNTLAPAPAMGADPILDALAAAVRNHRAAGLALTTTLGAAQFARRGQEIPIHGGTGREGAFNIVGYGAGNDTLLPGTTRGETLGPSGLTAEGYLINNGASTMMVTELTPDGPRARSVVSYSQAPDPSDARYHADQTLLFSQERRRDVLFVEADVLGDPEFEELVVTAPR